MPRLSKLALKLTNIPSLSAFIERHYSLCCTICTQRRVSMKSELIIQRAMIKSNIDLFSNTSAYSVNKKKWHCTPEIVCLLQKRRENILGPTFLVGFGLGLETEDRAEDRSFFRFQAMHRFNYLLYSMCLNFNSTCFNLFNLLTPSSWVKLTHFSLMNTNMGQYD